MIANANGIGDITYTHHVLPRSIQYIATKTEVESHIQCEVFVA